MFDRHYADLDFVGRRSQGKMLSHILGEAGYIPEARFNAIHGERRLIFAEVSGGLQIDIFLDRFEMSHKLDFRKRLEVEPLTVPGAELLLSKLQIAEVNEKDIVDIAMLTAGHQLGKVDGPATINVTHVAALCSSDWGLHTTASDNISRTRALAPDLVADRGLVEDVVEKMTELQAALDAAPKTAGWKLRARAGRRIRWYEIPDEVS